MNTSVAQSQEGLTMKCQIHNSDIIAVDLDSSINGSVTYLCSKCLVVKTNDNKISTILHAKEQIESYKKQKQKIKKNEIQLYLEYFQILFNNIEQFKCKVNNVLANISNELHKQISIQSKELSLSENCLIQTNFQEDIKLLSEFISSYDQQMEFEFIGSIQDQFQSISYDPDYLQAIQAFNNTKQILANFKNDNQIQLEPQNFKNNTKTMSLSTLCKFHNKEIIFIDLDSENIQTEKRLACGECLSDVRSCKYKTIEKINELWNQKNEKQNTNFNEQKSKKLIKQQKLNELITQIKKKYDSQLNRINETDFFQLKAKTGEISKYKQTTIQQLSDELLSNINDLVKQDKERVIFDDDLITRDIETQLEKIKQHFQLDIQESINILNDQSSDTLLQEVLEQLKKLQANKHIKQEQFLRTQELDELISSSKQLYCQMKLLNQTKISFQEHIKKINSILDHQIDVNIHQKLLDYVERFNHDFINLKKYCEIDNFEQKLQNLQLERNQMKDWIESKQKLINELELQLKQKVNEQNVLNEKLKKEQNNYSQYQSKSSEQQVILTNQIRQLNQELTKKDGLIQKNQEILGKLGLSLKPTLITDEYWIKIYQFLQKKTKKRIKNSNLIYKATTNGLNAQSFWKKIQNKENLLMIFQSKKNYVFGAYSPCRWIPDAGEVVDETYSSFIFSQTQNKEYPLNKNNPYAIYCDSSQGPIFGSDHDIYIKGDFKDGYSNLGNSYLFDLDEDENQEDYLYGQTKPDVKECEIYEIQFI